MGLLLAILISHPSVKAADHPISYVSVNSFEEMSRSSNWRQINKASIWIRVFSGRLCAWIVPENVASGDLSDFGDSGIIG